MEVERCLKGIPPSGATDVVRDQVQLLLSVENKHGTRKIFSQLFKPDIVWQGKFFLLCKDIVIKYVMAYLQENQV